MDTEQKLIRKIKKQGDHAATDALVGAITMKFTASSPDKHPQPRMPWT